jgi:hypothetical protein
MNNFERLKSLKSEYEMADIILYHVAELKKDTFKSDGSVDGLPLLRWLQEDYEEEE